MRTASNDWWRQMGAMSQGLLFLDGHFAPHQADVERRAEAAHCPQASGRRDRARRILIARRVRQLPALSLFR